MTDLLKKIFTVGVVTTTILWSVGATLVLPGVANAATCPTLVAGQLIKVVGKPTIYAVNKNLEVLAFDTGDEFKSWNLDLTYAGKYTPITMACYDTLKSPAAQPLFVGYRPGSFVISRESSDTLFVVEPNNTLAEITPAAATALYGAGYKKFTVKVTAWGTYVSRGASITEAKAHPGMYVKVSGVTYYVDASNTLREVTAAGLSANAVKTSFIHSVPASAIAGLSTGAKIDGELAELKDRTQGGLVNTGAAIGATTVSLNASQPAAATLVSDATTNQGAQAFAEVLKLNFTAPSDGDATVSVLTLKRSGISADTDIGNLHLYDGNTRLASNPTISSTKATFTKSTGLFTVSKGSTKTITVKLDLKNAVSAGKTLAFSVDSAADVSVLSGSVTGYFPVVGNTFSTASVTTDLGKLSFSNISPSAAISVDAGQTAYEIWRFQAANTSQDVEIRKLTFTIVGSVVVGDLKNFSLWDGATQLGSIVADISADKTVTFDFSNSPVLVTKGTTKTYSLKTDIIGGTNRTFRASFQTGYDILTYDKAYNVYLKANGLDSFTIIEPVTGSTAVNFTINTGTLTQTLPSDAPNGNIADAATSVVLGKFLWKANGEDVKISSLSVSSTCSTITNTLTNVKLLVNGSQIGTSISSLTADGAANTGWGSFGNSFIIKAGETAELKIVADLTATAIAADVTFVVGFPAGSSNAQGMNSLSSISTVAKNGNTLTVKSGTLSVVKNPSLGDKSSDNPTGTVNGSQIRVASFTITAGAGESVDISQIVLADNDTTNCIGDHMQNLTLRNASGTQLGATYANPSATCTTANTYTFNVSPVVNISAGSQYVVDVFADLKAALTTADVLIEVDAVTGSGHNTGTDWSAATGQDKALQKQYIAANGNLYVQIDPDTPVANNVLLGDTDVVIAKYKITASSTEAVNISQFIVSALFPTANSTGTYKNIRLYDNATGLQIGSAVAGFSSNATNATTTYEHATFSGLNLTIPKGVSVVLAVKADMSTYENLGLSATGQAIAPVMLRSYYGLSGNVPVTATGASSGTALTAVISTVGTVDSYVGAVGAYAASTTAYRANLSIAWASDSPSGSSSPNSAQTIAKVIVSNLSNAGSYTATVKYLNFSISTTISNTANRALKVYKDNLSTTVLATTTFTTGATIAATTGNTNFLDGDFTDVDITGGTSKTFLVTLDTTDAASAKTLSVTLPTSHTSMNSGATAYGIGWTDGVSSATATTVKTGDLPLANKTLTY